MKNRAKAMVLASFAADALALGAHWMYDTRMIDAKFGRVESYVDPTPPTHHRTRKAGELTHYGDQTLVLLESLDAAGGFDLQRFADRWQALFKDYDGYFDGATKQTLKGLAAGKPPGSSGSDSTDLAGAARIAPLAYRYRLEPDRLVAAACAQTGFTHNQQQVVEAAAFFGRVAHRVLAGASPRDAMGQIQRAHYPKGPIADWVSQGTQSVGEETRRAIARFGQMCEIEAAFPAVVHLIARYENSLSEALVENVMAGGDSAGRGLLVGMVLGAHLGIEAIPPAWLSELKAYAHVCRLLGRLDGEPT